jgi:dipeptidyl aminopeptidase/acylaminoacyl peptidase
MQPVPTPFGSWPSPLSARDVAEASLGLAYATANSGRLYWIESRPQERGRSALVAEGPDGIALDVTGAASNVRSRVHEYGGRAYSVADRLVAYCEFSDQRLYVQELGAAPRAVTPDGYRYADFADGSDGRTLFAVREDHSAPGGPFNTIVALDVDTPSAGRVLFHRSDFVAYPRASADGRIAFIAWNHPNMPWDATTLYVARLGAGGLEDLRAVAGHPDATAESVVEPVWDADGTLYFLSDRTGYWNLYRWKDGLIEAVTAIDADLGGPLWNVGISTYALSGDGRALARVCRAAVDELVLVDLANGHVSQLALPFVSFGSIGVLDAEHGFAIAASETEPQALIKYSLRNGSHQVVRAAGAPALAPDYVSRAEPIRFPTQPGADGVPREAHAFFYPPGNPRCVGLSDTKSPLLVLLHGGPTAHVSPALSPSIQFWTTRGFAVVNVNYGGSSGFGRDYRNRLLGAWGVVDLADAVAAVDHLVAQGRVDTARVAIRGGSAGGFTVLAGLAFTRRFAVGINYFGVADLEALAADTHKFESRYLDRLVAPLPDGQAIYRARSPIHHLDALAGALITFQGNEDRVVPPQQSRDIVAAARARGNPVAYIEFEGEQHGLRRAENIVRALEAELYFLGRIFGFVPADAIEPVPIDNPAPSPANGRSDRWRDPSATS